MAESLERLRSQEVLALADSNGRVRKVSIPINLSPPLTADDYRLELIGANEVFPSYKFEWKQDKKKSFEWRAELATPVTGSSEIARFGLASEKLSGEVSGSSLPDGLSLPCDLVQNCLLRIADVKVQMPDQGVLLRLRAPEMREAISFRFLDQSNPRNAPPVPGQLRLLSVPDKTKAKLCLDFKISGAIEPWRRESEEKRDNSWSISTKPPLSLRFQIRGDRVGDKKVERFDIWLKYLGLSVADTAKWNRTGPKLAGRPPYQVSKNFIDEHRQKAADMLFTKRHEKNSDEAARDKETSDDKKKSLDKEIQRVDKEIAELDQRRKEVEEVVETYKKVCECKLEFRVYIIVAGQQIDLVKTNGMK